MDMLVRHNGLGSEWPVMSATRKCSDARLLRLVMGSPSVVSEARIKRRITWGRGVLARFRYNDLKGAGRDCGGRGVVMQIQW